MVSFGIMIDTHLDQWNRPQSSDLPTHVQLDVFSIFFSPGFYFSSQHSSLPDISDIYLIIVFPN